MKNTKQKNSKAKRKLTREIYIPYTEKFEEVKDRPGITSAEMENFECIDRSMKVVDQDGRTAIAFYKGKIKQRMLMQLEPAVASLERSMTPAKGVGHPIHLGPWRRSSSKIHLSTDFKRARNHYTRNGIVPLWQNNAMKHVVKKVHTWLHHTDEDIYNDYCSINTDRYFGEAYLMAVLNKGGSGPHYDIMDEPEGLCCVVAYGDYTGGDLVFPELKLRFELRPGDIIYFRSRELWHENFAVKAHRRSIVFTVCHNCFTAAGQDTQREYLYFKQNADYVDEVQQ